MDAGEKIIAATDVLGMSGAMLSGSKTGYSMRYPNHVVFFNANLFDSEANKLWFGDLDITEQIEKLQRLSATIREPIYVTRENPFRFNPPTADVLQKLADEAHGGVVRIESANLPAN